MDEDNAGYDAFISFAAEDENLAERLEEALRADGLRVFRTPLRGAPEDVFPISSPWRRWRSVEHWSTRIRRAVPRLSEEELDARLASALDASPVLVVLWSGSHRGSTWCRREIDYFHRCHPTRPVIVVPADGCPISETLRAHHEDWVEADSFDQIPNKTAEYVASALTRKPSALRRSGDGSLRVPTPTASPGDELRGLSLRNLFTRPRRWATSLSPTGDISLFDLWWGGLRLPAAAPRKLSTVVFSIFLLTLSLVAGAIIPVIQAEIWRLLHHQLLVVFISVVGGVTIALTSGIGAALVATPWATGLGLLTSLLWWFGVGEHQGGVAGGFTAATLLGIAAAYRTAASPVEGVETPRPPQAPLWIAGALIVGFGLGLTFMSIGHLTLIPKAEWLWGDGVEVRGVFAWILTPRMLTEDAMRELITEGRVESGWHSIRMSWRSGLGAAAGAFVGTGVSIAGAQASARNYRRKVGRQKGLPGLLFGVLLAAALGAVLGALPPISPASPAEGIVIGCFVGVFTTSLFATPVFLVGSRASEGKRNIIQISGAVLALGFGHPQLIQFRNIADQVSSITIVAIGTLITSFTVSTALFPQREDQPTEPRQAAALTVSFSFLMLILMLISAHLRLPNNDTQTDALPKTNEVYEVALGALLPKSPPTAPPGGGSEPSVEPPTLTPKSDDNQGEQVGETKQAELDRNRSTKGVSARNKRENTRRARRKRKELALQRARARWGGENSEGSGWNGSGGGDQLGSSWVQRISNGKYEVRVPPGFELQLSASFEGGLAAQLEIVGQTTIGKPGGSWTSPVAGAKGLQFHLKGHKKHPCSIHTPSPYSAVIGFEDSSDHDCNEPLVTLRLVDAGRLPSNGQ